MHVHGPRGGAAMQLVVSFNLTRAWGAWPPPVQGGLQHPQVDVFQLSVGLSPWTSFLGAEAQFGVPEWNVQLPQNDGAVHLNWGPQELAREPLLMPGQN